MAVGGAPNGSEGAEEDWGALNGSGLDDAWGAPKGSDAGGAPKGSEAGGGLAAGGAPNGSAGVLEACGALKGSAAGGCCGGCCGAAGGEVAPIRSARSSLSPDVCGAGAVRSFSWPAMAMICRRLGVSLLGGASKPPPPLGAALFPCLRRAAAPPPPMLMRIFSPCLRLMSTCGSLSSAGAFANSSSIFLDFSNS